MRQVQKRRVFWSQLFLGASLLIGGLATAPVLADTAAVSSLQATPPATAEWVDLQAYMGRWYEIAAIPQIYERGCYGATAEYFLHPEGKVQVVNSCHEGSLDGPVRKVRGLAEVVDPSSNAKLRVSFFWPFWGDYWIFYVADDYSLALVGSPDRKALWILARQAQIPAASYDEMIEKAAALGFNTQAIAKMPQPAPTSADRP